MRSSPVAVLVAGILLGFPTAGRAAPEPGVIRRVQSGNRALVSWESSLEDAVGRIGVVEDDGRAVALVRVTKAAGRSVTVQGLDIHSEAGLRKGRKVLLKEGRPSEPKEGEASILVWSDRTGANLEVDTSGAGEVPAFLVLRPGSHEFVVTLPGEGRAGAILEVPSGREAILFLGGRHLPARSYRDLGHLYWWDPLPPSATRSRRDAAPQLALRWIDEPNGRRVYLPSSAVKPPRRIGRSGVREPERPADSKSRSLVTVEGVIGTDGRFEHLQAIASRRAELAVSALQAVRQWVFEPALLNGRPVPVLSTVVVDVAPRQRRDAPGSPR